MSPADVSQTLDRLEQAVKAHGGFCVVKDPCLEVDRLGWRAYLLVQATRSRKRPFRIHGNGDSAEAAVDHLIAGLDAWEQAIR